MNKSELTEHLAMPLGMSTASARDAVDGVFGTIGEALTRCDEMRVVGFGCFNARNPPVRTGCHPGTGETVEKEPAKGLAFKPGTLIDDAANAGYVLKMGGGGDGTRKACGDVYVEAVRWR